MIETPRAFNGIMPDLHWALSTPSVIYQQGDGIYRRELSNSTSVLLCTGISSLAFPRVASDGRHVIFRAASSLPSVWEEGKGVSTLSQAKAAGNDPVSVDAVRLVWQESVGAPIRYTRRAEPGTTYSTGVRAIGTGIAWTTPDAVFMRDQVRLAYPGMTQPHRVGDYVVGEHPESGVIVRHVPSARECRVLAGHTTFTPRLAVRGSELAVVAWGGEAGTNYIHWALLEDHDLKPPVKPPPPPPMTYPNLLPLVQKYRQKYDAMPPSPKRAWTIINAVAWEARDKGAGLRYKPEGSNWNERATDIIIFPDGTAYDALGDGEGAARPQWGLASGSPLSKSLWRAPVEPEADQPQTPPTNPPGEDPGNQSGGDGGSTSDANLQAQVAEILRILQTVFRV